MYLPEQFRETDPERIAAVIEGYPFATLITAPDGVPFVSHLPLLYQRGAGAHGRLLGHLARANPQWQHLASGREVLAVFQGPHAYVSPSWYSSPGVPTWNYAAVHLRGSPRIVDDASELEALLAQITRIHESPMPSPWQPDLAGERRSRLLGMIVGFEIAVTDLQAKFKLSQNWPPEEQQRIARELGRSGNQIEVATGELMKGKS